MASGPTSHAITSQIATVTSWTAAAGLHRDRFAGLLAVAGAVVAARARDADWQGAGGREVEDVVVDFRDTAVEVDGLVRERTAIDPRRRRRV
jgi:hypothetical protein